MKSMFGRRTKGDLDVKNGPIMELACSLNNWGFL